MLFRHLKGADSWTRIFLSKRCQHKSGQQRRPLVNIEGEVIGINTLIRGLRTGIGFAIPSEPRERDFGQAHF